MNWLIIPFLIIPSLVVFTMVYPFAEYNYDCPSATTDLEGNESCTFNKHVVWVFLSITSGTEFGIPSDCQIAEAWNGACWFEESNNPDAYYHTGTIPLSLAFLTLVIVEWRLHKRKASYNKETMEEFR